MFLFLLPAILSNFMRYTEAVSRRCSVKKVFLKILPNSLKNNCAGVSFLIKPIEKEILAQLFLCEFYEIFKNTFFIENLRWRLVDIEEQK